MLSEWKILNLKEVAFKIQDGNYGANYPKSVELVERGIPFLTSKVIGANGTIRKDKFDYITEEKHKSLRKAQIISGDILFTNRGANVGAIAITPAFIKTANIGPQLTLIRCNDKVINDYLFQFLKGGFFKKQIRQQDSGSAMNFFGVKDTERFKVLVPPLPEQKKIAQILSTWDKAITTTEKLLANSQHQKKALMQQLLTGKKRLLDENGVRFNGEWKNVEIGEFLKESRVPSKSNDPSKRLTVRLNLKGVQTREFRGTEAANSTAHFVRSSGQFIYGKQNIHKGAVGIIPGSLNGFETSQDLPAFDFTGKCDASWFFQYMCQEKFYTSLEDKMSGTGSKRLSPKILFKLKIACPKIQEQQKIAIILSAADQEISVIKQKIGCLKREKRSLMQQLLTGKRRVKVEAA